MKRYIPLLRPASFATLPRGLAWTYVEVPSYITKRPDLPTSRHPHGVIECRELTAEEMTTFDLREVGAEGDADEHVKDWRYQQEWVGLMELVGGKRL